jgi:2-polyprenyl-6-methoxyphenol hydroxylase-like FAD-dependent oxidoreductase
VPEIVMCGGGVIGLAAATMLARDGHDVTLFERDHGEVPGSVEDAWDRWERTGVPQFRQPHNLFPGYRTVLDQEMPDVLAGLIDGGGRWVDFLDGMPPFITDRTERPGDERFRFVTARRPTVEYVHARVAADQPGLHVRRGAKVQGLLTETNRSGIPHVVGVRTADGDVRADLVVDAMGRRSPMGDWIAAAGGRAPTVTSQDCGFTYYTRYYTGDVQPIPLAPTVTCFGTFLVLTLLSDNDTWSVTLWGPNDDRPLKSFKDPAVFDAVVRACPTHGHWLDGQALTDVLPMGGILDRHRRFVVDGQPVVTGAASVGDAWACTNPSAGRGMSIGILHAQLLRDLVRTMEDPLDFARRWDTTTEEVLAPWYWNQLAADGARLARMAAERDGAAPEPDAGAPLPPEFADAARAMLYDPDVFRAVAETIGCLATPQAVFARPGMWEKVTSTPGEALAMPGPTRQQLLELVS